MIPTVCPAYLPNVKYCAWIVQQQKNYFSGSTTYQKQTFRNRCEICADSGKLTLSAPIIHKKEQEYQKFSEVELEYKTLWNRIHWKSITTAYRSSPYFEFYEDELRPLFQKEDDLLLPFVLECIEAINLCLELDFNPTTSKVFKKDSTENDFRFLIKARKTVTIQTKPYIQVFQAKHGYISNLSILDLLFNMGPETLNYLKTHQPIQINIEKHEGLLNF